MKVTVAGILLELVPGEKEGKKYKTARIFQPGESSLVSVRLPENAEFESGQHVQFSGRLLTWRTREGVGTMVLATAGE